MEPIYLDHNATTPVADEVWRQMLPYFGKQYGNPSSRHGFGRAARQAVEEAREKVAAVVGAHPSQVIFTSGGTEANNLALKGAAAWLKPGVIAVSRIEHPCVAQPAKGLRRQGWKLREVAVDAECRLDLDDLERTLAESPALVSVMLANNETGALQDVAAVAERARRKGALAHTDAVQALGKMEVDFRGLGVDMMTLSAHKIYGPKGVGALIVDKRVELAPLLSGGGQEWGIRSGTENVPAIVGFGAACELVSGRLARVLQESAGLRDRLEAGLKKMGAVIFAAGAERLPNTSFFALPGIEGETLVMALDRAGFAVASGAACSSASSEISPVLAAMGVEPSLAKGAVRVSLGQENTAAQVDAFLAALGGELNRLRSMAAVMAV
ncbi:MAG: cysteine desulfurase family protein [Sulfuricellaceae bacterium]|jgi:cysteine desulfurase